MNVPRDREALTCVSLLLEAWRRGASKDLTYRLLADVNRWAVYGEISDGCRQRLRRFHQEAWNKIQAREDKEMKTQKLMAARIAAIIVLTTIFFLGCSIAYSAPAPLPKRVKEAALPKPPDFCMMSWAGSSYRTSFNHDGSYVAQLQDGPSWQGFWVVRKENDNIWLCVRERTNPDAIFIEWEFPLIESLYQMTKTRGGMEVRLEIGAAKPDQ